MDERETNSFLVGLMFGIAVTLGGTYAYSELSKRKVETATVADVARVYDFVQKTNIGVAKNLQAMQKQIDALKPKPVVPKEKKHHKCGGAR